ncbi:hypothetical protein FRC04_002262 [Tulasnella sp. 424]|nr:hypothetical protein FRC04_002262 [Tulasnella sp. 424]
MQPVHEPHGFLGPLPLELFISIITLSLDSANPLDDLIRLEQLRLVSKTWLWTIEYTPQFWTYIPDDPKASARINEWIKKSGNAPLRIAYRNFTQFHGPFMSLLYPLLHRWKSVSISTVHWNVSAFLDKPAPLLEELILRGVSFGPDTSLFASATPSLAVVEFLDVKVPRDLSCLKDLKSLQLRGVTNPSGKFTIGRLYDILSASPNLKRLNLDTNYEDDTCRRDPLLFPDLADITVHTTFDPSETTSAIVSMIEAPNLTNLSTQFDDLAPAPVLRLSTSWLRRQSLDQPKEYNVTIRLDSILVSVVLKGTSSSPSKGPQLLLSLRRPTLINPLIEILETAERLIPPCAVVTMDVDGTNPIVDYLKTPRAEQDGTQRWPLPKLRSIHFRLSDASQSFALASDFARTRRDVALITTDAEVGTTHATSKYYNTTRT